MGTLLQPSAIAVATTAIATRTRSMDLRLFMVLSRKLASNVKAPESKLAANCIRSPADAQQRIGTLGVRLHVVHSRPCYHEVRKL